MVNKDFFDFPLPSRNYKLVVYCQTYNQRCYIEDTLKGFISQKTDFPFCAVVIDDCSTDGQQNVIQEYADKFPGIIIPIFLPYNHHSKGENKDRYMRPWIEASEYLAICEGDDYWTDENKLQKQVDLLDSNKDCTLTYHACKNIFVEGFTGSKDCFCENVVEEYYLKDMLLGYPFQTGTIVCRSSFWLSYVCQKCLSILHYDIVLYFCAAYEGKVVGINKQMSVYRRNNQGISNAIHKGGKLENFIAKWRQIGKFCDRETKALIHRIRIASFLYDLSNVSMALCLKELVQEFKYSPITSLSVIKKIIVKRIKRLAKIIIR